MTDKQTFIKFLEDNNFTVNSNFIGFANIIPYHQKTTKGDHVLLRELIVVMFSGVNTKEGDLGCVTFCYHGAKRKKHCRTSCNTEVLKKSFCPKDATEAIKTFKQWQLESEQIRKTWQTIL